MIEQTPALTAEEREERRRQRQARRKQKRRAQRRRILRRLLLWGGAAACVALLAVAGLKWSDTHAVQPPEEETQTTPAPAVSAAASDGAEEPTPRKTAQTVELGEELDSDYAVVLDLETLEILGEKGAETLISPASMTKILTVLVAAEQGVDPDALYTVPVEVADYSYSNGCSVVGLKTGETVSVRELFYGTILPSGADAALSLALYTAGSQEAFVALMNKKAAELGLSDGAHFTNCAGLYAADHLCTVTDMALILRAALENELCAQVLAAHTYETVPTPEHPDGQILSNWFLRRIEDKDTGTYTVIGAKTGYVNESGSCAASVGEDASGRRLLCVTAKAGSSWRCIYDHVALYERFPLS